MDTILLVLALVVALLALVAACASAWFAHLGLRLARDQADALERTSLDLAERLAQATTSTRAVEDVARQGAEASRSAADRAADAMHRMSALETQVVARLAALSSGGEQAQAALRAEVGQMRQHAAQSAADLRTELRASLGEFRDETTKGLSNMVLQSQGQFKDFGTRLSLAQQATEASLERVRGVVHERLGAIQADTRQKLDEIRAMVDEKLQSTLEKRLSESFMRVTQSLAQVERGLGEMRELGSGVSDLKRLMGNVKARGVWGEVVLGTLLEQFLSPGQFERNFAADAKSNERVVFGVRLPGRGGGGAGGATGGDDDAVWLPIDSKFPKEDYERLSAAAERGDADAVADASRALEAVVRASARTISEKYIRSPRTTDWAILFVPTEGLYAEILRRHGLVEELQRSTRVIVQGPTTLAAFLNVIQVGFRTMQVERKSSEVWRLLGDVQRGFGQFGEALDAVQRKLGEASTKLEQATTRSKQVAKKLASVELPAETGPIGDAVPRIGDAPPRIGDAPRGPAGARLIEGAGDFALKSDGPVSTPRLIPGARTPSDAKDNRD
jgi:DNA recombination protein RmuC